MSMSSNKASSKTAGPQANRPLLIVLSGPSGVRKTELTRKLIERNWPGHVLVTVTTRRPRPDENDGAHYHFVTAERFRQMSANGELLEYAEIHGSWYGVPLVELQEHLSAGQDVIMSINPQGVQAIQQKVHGAVYVFLVPESVDSLIQRTDSHGHNSPEQRALRILHAEREMEELHRYDYKIVTRELQLETAVDQLQAILQAEHLRAHLESPNLPSIQG